MSLNDALLREALRHNVALRHYTNSVVYKVIAVLHRTDASLAAELAAVLSSVEPSTFKIARLESLLTSVMTLNREAYELAGRALTDALQEFTPYEASYQANMLQAAMPATVSVASVNAAQVYAAAMARPFQGVLLKEVLKDLEASKAKLVRRTVAQGFVEGETTAQIVRKLRGTRANRYADGLFARPRRDVEAVVRTSMGHYASFIQSRVAEENSDLIKAVQWAATLDLRTSATCRLRDGKQYHPVTHKPIGHDLPWMGGPGVAHWNCRSYQVMVTKSWRELGLDADDLPPATRASMNGQVPADVTYHEWLKELTAAEQDKVLGQTRGRLFRDGQLSLEAMYSDKGRMLTLRELKEMDKVALSGGKMLQ